MFTHKDRFSAVQLYVLGTKYFSLAVITRIGAACSCRRTARFIRIHCDNLMGYITLCLDSTNEAGQWYVRHKYFIVLYHRLHVSTYIQVL